MGRTRSRLKRNVIANYAGGVWTALMGIIFAPLYIHFLGIEAFGLIGFYVSLQAWMVIIDMGFTPSLNREMARFDAGEITPQNAKELLRTLEVIYFFITLSTILLIYFLAPDIATKWLVVETLEDREVVTALIVMGISISLRWFSTLYRGAMMGLQRQVWLNGSNIVFATLRGPGVIIILAFVSATIEAFFLYQGFLHALECLIIRSKLYRVLPPINGTRFNLTSLAAMWRFALGVSGINILGALLTQLDKIMLSALVPLSTLGYYTLASTVAGALFVLVSPVSNAAFPRFTEALSTRDQPSLIAAYRDLAQLLATVVIPVSCVLSVFSTHVLLHWTQDPAITSDSAPITAILVLGTMLNGVLNLPYILQLASGWTRLIFTFNLIAVCAYLPIVYIGIQQAGAIAPALFWLGLNICYVLIAVPLMHRTLLPEEKLRWYRDALLFPLLTSSVVVGLARWLLPVPSLDSMFSDVLILVSVVLLALLASGFSTPLGRRYFVRALAGA